MSLLKRFQEFVKPDQKQPTPDPTPEAKQPYRPESPTAKIHEAESREELLTRLLDLGVSNGLAGADLSAGFRERHDHILIDLRAINMEMDLALDQRAIRWEDAEWAQRRLEQIVKWAEASNIPVRTIEAGGPAPVLKPTWAAGTEEESAKPKKPKRGKPVGRCFPAFVAEDPAAAPPAPKPERTPAPVRPIPDNWRDLVAEAREQAQEILDKPRAERTTANYNRLFRRMDKAGQTPLEYAKALETTKGTYYTLKAAYQYGLAKQIHEAKEAVMTPTAIMAAGDPQRAEAFAVMQDAMKKLAASRPDYEIQNRDKHLCEYEPARKRAGKRTSLRGLPSDWRDKMLDAVAPKHKLTVAASAATGCRPIELQTGVRFQQQGDLVSVTIQGAKCRNKPDGTPLAGVQERTFTLDPAQSKAVAMIAAAIPPGGELVVKANRWTARDNINAAAEACKLRDKGVSAYSFRHQLGADLKAAGYSNADIAEIMGHQSEASCQAYGFATQGAGGCAAAPAAGAGAGPR